MLVFIGIFAFFLTISPSLGVSYLRASYAASGSLTKVTSGLVAFDPLNQQLTMSQLENSNYWKFSGDAPGEGAPYNFYENSSGLHIAVQAKNNSTFAGFFAKSPNTDFVLVHVRITAPAKTVPQGSFESGLYLQTADGNVNYVTCTSFTTSQGTIWEIVWATGNSNGATNFKTLWSSGFGLPLTEDCTIITNGNNYLKVYLDGKQVYSSSSLNLQMPKPFQIYLEPETSYNGTELYATFLNYYLTSSEYLTVSGLPSNAAKVELVNPSSGNVLASALKQSGSASIEVGKFVLPLGAEIEVLSSSNSVLSSTQGSVSVYGGDSYSDDGSTAGGNITLSIKTVSQSGTQITGLYAYISNSSGQVVSQGYSPLTYSGAIKGQTYTSCVENYNQYTFLHWSNGSTNPCLTKTFTQSSTMVAYYST